MYGFVTDGARLPTKKLAGWDLLQLRSSLPLKWGNVPRHLLKLVLGIIGRGYNYKTWLFVRG